MTRNSLYHRSKLMGLDVADAIERLVTRDEQGLPLALSKLQVVSELIVIANTDDDGTVVPVSKSSETFTRENYLISLSTSRVFQSGYEQYATRSGNPTLPVTDYFFNHVYDDSVRDSLDAMTSTDLKQSLPKRPSIPLDEDDVPIKEENGDYIPSGKIAGIAVFPVGSRAALIARWESRQVNVAIGHVEKSLTGLARVRPDSKMLTVAKQQAKLFVHDLKKATPKEQS